MKKLLFIAILLTSFIGASQNIPVYDGYGFEQNNTAELAAIVNKAQGDLFYNTDISGHVFWNGSAFQSFFQSPLSQANQIIPDNTQRNIQLGDNFATPASLQFFNGGFNGYIMGIFGDGSGVNFASPPTITNWNNPSNDNEVITKGFADANYLGGGGGTYTAGNGLNLSAFEFSVDTGDAIFGQWDKDVTDDFDGDFTSLSNIPSGLADGDDDTIADGSETVINQGTNVTITGTGTSGSPYVINSTASGGGGTGDFKADGTVPMNGNINLDDNNINNVATINADVGQFADELLLPKGTIVPTISGNLYFNTSAGKYQAGNATDDGTWNFLTDNDIGDTVASQASVDNLGNENSGDETEATIKTKLAGGTGLDDDHLADDGISPSKFDVDNSPTDEFSLTYESSTQKGVWARRIKSDITGLTNAVEVHNIVFAPEADAAGYPADPNRGVIITDKKLIESFKIPLGTVGADIAVGTDVSFTDVLDDITVTRVEASLKTAPTGSVATFDINEDGVSILSTKITIDTTESFSVDAATQPVISDTAIDANSFLTIDIDGVGSTIAGADGTVTIFFYRNQP